MMHLLVAWDHGPANPTVRSVILDRAPETEDRGHGNRATYVPPAAHRHASKRADADSHADNDGNAGSDRGMDNGTMPERQ